MVCVCFGRCGCCLTSWAMFQTFRDSRVLFAANLSYWFLDVWLLPACQMSWKRMYFSFCLWQWQVCYSCVLSDKSGLCKHGGIEHYSQVKTIILIENLEKYCSVAYLLHPPSCTGDLLFCVCHCVTAGVWVYGWFSLLYSTRLKSIKIFNIHNLPSGGWGRNVYFCASSSLLPHRFVSTWVFPIILLALNSLSSFSLTHIYPTVLNKL